MEIILFNVTLKVYEDGNILVKKKDIFYEKKCILNNNGYKKLQLEFERKQKNYLVHRIIAYAYLELDIENPKLQVDHIDRDKSNNNVSNLRIVTHQQNHFNMNAKGYTWYKRDKKWRASIGLNGKDIYLGSFDKEEDASKAYQDAKLIYHII